MFIKNLWNKILAMFQRKTSSTDREYQDNEYYNMQYQNIKDINYNAIFSTKLSNYCANESSIIIEETNKRAKYMNEIAQEIWNDRKRIFNRMLGTGGVFVIPFYAKGEMQYNIVPQFRVSINEMIGKKIVNMTVLADVYIQKNGFTKTMCYRWTDYSIENGREVIRQRYTDENGGVVGKPDIWKDINDEFIISNVEKITCGYFKSPIDNRMNKDDYGVPLTYGCESTIKEIKITLKQIIDEFEAKKVFIGVDYTMFKKDKNGHDILPDSPLYKKFNADKDDLWEVFDPAFRDSSYYARLQELYARLEKQIGTSKGILTEVETQDATATAIKKALYDTFTIVADTRDAFEKGFTDLLDGINILANYYNITPMGDYEVNFDWSYDLLESTEETFNQLTQGNSMGVVKDEEVRQFIFPDEDIEEAKKAIQEIKDNEPKTEDLLKNNNFKRNPEEDEEELDKEEDKKE